jgi:hypothetical protein
VHPPVAHQNYLARSDTATTTFVPLGCFLLQVTVAPSAYVEVVFVTFLWESLQESFVMVLLCGMSLASWLLALRECGGYDDLRGSDRLSVIPYVHGRTELYCAQACLA